MLEILKKFEPLNIAEKGLLKAASQGQTIKFGQKVPMVPEPNAMVRAEVIRELLLKGADSFPDSFRGVMVEGAWINGVLSLDHCSCSDRLYLRRCNIPDYIDLSYAKLAEFSLNGSKITQLSASNASFTGGLNLRDGFSSENTVELTMATITGSLCCDGGSFLAEDGLSVEHVRDSINLQNVRISGAVMMGASTMKDGSNPIPFRAFGTVRLTEAKVLGSLNFVGSQIRSNRDLAIAGQDIHVATSVALSRGHEKHQKLECQGRVDLNSSEIGGQVLCVGANVSLMTDDSSRDALNLDWARVSGSVIILKTVLVGGFGLSHAKFEAQFTMKDSSIDAQGGIAVNGNALFAANSCLYHNTSTRGVVNLSYSEIGGNLEIEGGEAFGGPFPGVKERIELMVESSVIGGSVFFRDGFSAVGRISISQARVTHRVEFINSKLNADGEFCLTADSLNVGSTLIWRYIEIISGKVSLLDAKAICLGDDLNCWPTDGQLYLTGFEYERFSLSKPAPAERIKWIKDSFEGEQHAQPFLNLAEVYSRSGNRSARKDVLISMEKAIRRRNRVWLRTGGGLRFAMAVLAWVWEVCILGPFIGYGFAPSRSIWAALILILATTFCANKVWEAGDFVPEPAPILVSNDWVKYSQDDGIQNPAKRWIERGNGGQDFETFMPMVYAIDVVIPLINLAQDDAWAVSTERSDYGWYWHRIEWILRLVGWAIAALLGASLTGLVRSF